MLKGIEALSQPESVETLMAAHPLVPVDPALPGGGWWCGVLVWRGDVVVRDPGFGLLA